MITKTKNISILHPLLLDISEGNRIFIDCISSSVAKFLYLLDVKFCCGIPGLTCRISNTGYKIPGLTGWISNTGYQVLLLNSWTYLKNIQHWISSSAAEFLDFSKVKSPKIKNYELFLDF